MQQMVFEADSKEQLQELADKLWNQHGVSGEMSIRPLAGNRWRLEVMPEKDVRDSVLEKFAQFRVEAGD